MKKNLKYKIVTVRPKYRRTNLEFLSDTTHN